MKKSVAVFLILAMVVLAANTTFAAYKKEYKLSVVVGPTFKWSIAAQNFADEVREKTDGRINIKCYFGGTLFAGKQTNEFMLLSQGVADFAFGSTINWSPQVKELNLFSLPFLFPNYEALDAVKTSEVGQEIFNTIEKKGVLGLAWAENGFREVTNNKRPIETPEDMEGLKIRIVGSPIFVDIFRAFGADPMAINWSEAVTGFQQGTVDGQENPIVSVLFPVKIWQYHDYITVWHATIDPLIVGVSKKSWDAFTPEDQKIVRAAAEKWGQWEIDEVRKGLADSNAALEELEAKGMEVTIISPEARQAFKAQSKEVYNKWKKTVDPDLVEAAEAIVQEYE
jgi:TRAP-type transport system periplasmic protein